MGIFAKIEWCFDAQGNQVFSGLGSGSALFGGETLDLLKQIWLPAIMAL